MSFHSVRNPDAPSNFHPLRPDNASDGVLEDAAAEARAQRCVYCDECPTPGEPSFRVPAIETRKCDAAGIGCGQYVCDSRECALLHQGECRDAACEAAAR